MEREISVDAQLSLPGVATGEAPREAFEYLAALRKWYGGSKTKRRPTDVEIAGLMGPPGRPMSVRNWQRRKAELRGTDEKKRLGGYDWLEGQRSHGPDWHPSWEHSVVRSIAQAQDQEPFTLHVIRIPGFDEHMQPVLVEETFDAEGNSVARRLVTPHRNGTLLGHLSAVAAGLSAFALLDLSDGRLDGILHWCRVLLAHLSPSASMA